MNEVEKRVQEHIINCDRKRCKECKAIYIEYFITDPKIKAVYRYQQGEKFKEYKKIYYQKNRQEILSNRLDRIRTELLK